MQNCNLEGFLGMPFKGCLGLLELMFKKNWYIINVKAGVYNEQVVIQRHQDIQTCSVLVIWRFDTKIIE